MDTCSPAYENQSHSCFTKEALIKIIRAYNQNNVSPIQIGGRDSKKDMWDAVQSKLHEKCGNNETCWIEQPFLKKNPELSKFFKPLAPLGQYQWLSTDDIYGVMRQYDEKHSDFKFMGALPMDFLKLKDPDSTSLQNLDLDQAMKKYRNVGIVFNLDPSTKGGSHWVSMMIKPNIREFCYFDSYGDKKKYPNKYGFAYYDSNGNIHRENNISMPTAIQDLIHRLTSKSVENIKNGKKAPGGSFAKKPFKIKINTIQHQYANSECGIYSMMFLIKSLNQSFENITRQIVADEEANQFRNLYFRRR